LKKRRTKRNRREEILAATEKLLRSRGLSGVTTRLIAKTVGCSEGAIYVHFKNRVDLLLAVLERSLPQMLEPLRALDAEGRTGTPRANLEKAAQGIFSFHKRVTPMIAGLFAEPELLLAYRKSLATGAKGPHRAIGRLADYVRSQQDAGRIDTSVDATMAATLLMSASFFRAFSEDFFGQAIHPGSDEFLRQVVAAITPRKG
jgi:AcrR family transcriptional regulator